MNDEIKEILELQNKIDGIKNDTYTMKYIEWKAILDYITNLQTIEQQYSAILSENAELENKITNLQEENENLKDYLKIMEKGKDNNLNRFLDYKSRCEKAIEYFKFENPEIFKSKKYSNHLWTIDGLTIKRFLNILTGEDNDR